jgi:FSR family fosmidomycin resistance protein-like MFS transporter
LASGVTLGLAVSMGGIFAPILGAVADNFGLLTAIYTIAAIATIPLIFSFTLPEVKKS